MSENETKKPTYEDLQAALAETRTELEQARTHAIRVQYRMTDYSLHQTFTREVSAFHRKSLLPLVAIVEQILTQSKDGATPEIKAKLVELSNFVDDVKARTKFFEGQALVAKARQNAIDEQKKLEEKQA